MPALSPLSGDHPGTYPIYNYKISSFTVPQGSAASPYVLTNSTRSYPVNSAKNLAAMVNADLFYADSIVMSALRTTASTDAFTLKLQYSVDGGTNWTDISPTLAFGGGGGANIPNIVTDTVGRISGAPDYPITGNALLIRAVVSTAVSPTTDAFTLTNVWITMPFVYIGG